METRTLLPALKKTHMSIHLVKEEEFSSSEDESIIEDFIVKKEAAIARDNVVDEYNKNVPAEKLWFTTKKSVFDQIIHFKFNQVIHLAPGEFCLGELDGYAALAHYQQGSKIFCKTDAKKIEYYQSIDPFFGRLGKYVINIPENKCAKLSIENKPYIYHAGTHIIPANHVQFDAKNDLLDLNQLHINYGPIHIFNIPSGFFGRISINNRDRLLDPGAYEFANHPSLICRDPLLVAQAQPHVQSGIYHRITVPPGKIAAIHYKNTAYLLSHRVEPYFYRDVNFKMMPTQTGSLFYDATEKLIIHGPLKRIIPHSGEVVITNNCGKLKILYPNYKQPQPIEINAATHQVLGFLNVSNQSLAIPYGAGNTIMLDYKISDPEKVAKEFRASHSGWLDRITDYITREAVIHISTYLKPLIKKNDLSFFSSNSNVQKTSHAKENSLEQVNQALRKTLEAYGITLIKINVSQVKMEGIFKSDRSLADEALRSKHKAEKTKEEKPKVTSAASSPIFSRRNMSRQNTDEKNKNTSNQNHKELTRRRFSAEFF